MGMVTARPFAVRRRRNDCWGASTEPSGGELLAIALVSLLGGMPAGVAFVTPTMNTKLSFFTDIVVAAGHGAAVGNDSETPAQAWPLLFPDVTILAAEPA